MDQFSIEQGQPGSLWSRINGRNLSPTSSGAQSPEPGRPIRWKDGSSRLISLRKYSLAICVVEALAITFLIYLLWRLPPSNNDPNAQHGNVSDLSQPCRTYYSKQDSAKVTVWPGLVPTCTLRRHDLAQSVRCKSNDIDFCRPPYSNRDTTEAKEPKMLEVVETSKAGRRMQQRWQAAKVISCDRPPVDAKMDSLCRFGTRVQLNVAKKGQQIVGWGGALTDSSINSILSLSVNGTRRLLDDYFGPDGLMFNMVRVTIGGSDFSARFYTNEDLKGDEDKPRLDNIKLWLERVFRLREEDYLYKIPMLRMLVDEYNLKGREIKLFASMWSPPVWMKTNNHFNRGQLKGRIDDEPVNQTNLYSQRNPEVYFAALADLKLKWLTSYWERSVRFWGLTVMNEPIFAVQPFLQFNTMIFPREDYANYVVKHLGPRLKADPRFRPIKLMVHDDNRRYLLNFTKPILDQSRVHQFVDGVSVHGYVDQEYELMDTIYESYKDTYRTSSAREPDDWFVLPTELCSGHLPFMEKALVGNWHRGIHYALDIIHSLQHSAAGWVDWNMVLDTEGGPGWLGGRLDAPIIVDKGADLYHKSPMFYVLGQFSRFLPPGSQRIATQVFNDLYDHQFEVVAFSMPATNEKLKMAFVIVNNNPYEVQLLLPTSAQGQNFHLLQCSPDSVTTVLYTLADS